MAELCNPAGTAGQSGADHRPVQAVADDIARAAPAPDEGDGTASADPDDALQQLTTAVTRPAARGHGGGWLEGIREHVGYQGPVLSTRFP